jgi:starch synthase
VRIAFATPEMYPFSKTGGLADVSQALPAALAGLHNAVHVFTPLHRSAAEWLEQHADHVEVEHLPNKLWIGDEQREAGYRTFTQNGVQITFIDQQWYFDRPHPYLDGFGNDYGDNVARFAFFCRAILEYYLWKDCAPDVFHINDWQSSLIALYLRTLYDTGPLAGKPTLLTLHNIGYQGVFSKDHLYATGLGWDVFTAALIEYFDNLNLLKCGAATATAINAVSPTYALEIQTPEFGRGLEGIFAQHQHKLQGILNGIDATVWDPACDPHLPAHYNADDLRGKAVCKRVLQRRFNLPLRPRTLLMGIISRLDPQKGIDLVCQALPQIANLDVQLVVLGSGPAYLEQQLVALANAYPEQISVQLGYDEPLAHLIEAGCDCFLMPSIYEPCGLNQLYSQRYGTVPVVRETGGLKDTVVNYTPRRFATGKASGFTFRLASSHALADAIHRSAKLYYTNRRAWNQLARQIMRIDHSWAARAVSYLLLYERLVQTASSRGEACGQ